MQILLAISGICVVAAVVLLPWVWWNATASLQSCREPGAVLNDNEMCRSWYGGQSSPGWRDAVALYRVLGVVAALCCLPFAWVMWRRPRVFWAIAAIGALLLVAAWLVGSLGPP